MGIRVPWIMFYSVRCLKIVSSSLAVVANFIVRTFRISSCSLCRCRYSRETIRECVQISFALIIRFQIKRKVRCLQRTERVNTDEIGFGGGVTDTFPTYSHRMHPTNSLRYQRVALTSAFQYIAAIKFWYCCLALLRGRGASSVPLHFTRSKSPRHETKIK